MDHPLKEIAFTPWNLREIDPDTNLITLPKGFFWRVERYSQNDPDYYSFSLMESVAKKSWFSAEKASSRRVVRTYVYHPDNRNAFVAACNELLDRVKSELSNDEYLGDYPPRKMQ